MKHLALPAITLGVGLAAPLARFVRSGMLDVMGTDYIRTARAKGLPGQLIVRRHALRNGLLSVVTVFGLEFGSMLGGAVITESVFSWPGIGTLLLTAIKQRDYAMIQGAVLFISVVFIVVNLAVDSGLRRARPSHSSMSAVGRGWTVDASRRGRTVQGAAGVPPAADRQSSGAPRSGDHPSADARGGPGAMDRPT